MQQMLQSAPSRGMKKDACIKEGCSPRDHGDCVQQGSDIARHLGFGEQRACCIAEGYEGCADQEQESQVHAGVRVGEGVDQHQGTQRCRGCQLGEVRDGPRPPVGQILQPCRRMSEEGTGADWFCLVWSAAGRRGACWGQELGRVLASTRAHSAAVAASWVKWAMAQDPQ